MGAFRFVPRFWHAISLMREEAFPANELNASEATGEKGSERKSRELERRRIEDIIGKGSAVAERMPVMPQRVLLRAELSPAL